MQLALGLLLAPLLVGVVRRTKAFFAGRRGPPLLQAYADLWKLAHKGAVYSPTTTWVFRAGPVVALACVLLALALLPTVGVPGIFAFPGDLLLLTGVLSLGRLAMVLAALDTGSAFEGMGASREAWFGSLAEPALLLCLASLARVTGQGSLATIQEALGPAAWAHAGGALVLACVALFGMLLVENARIPFDDPTTHLELTMVHEGMVLDHGGPDLALVELGAALKLWVFASLLTGALVPVRSGDVSLDAVAHLAGIAAIGVAVGVVESTMARLRLLHVPQLLVGIGVLAFLAVLLAPWGSGLVTTSLAVAILAAVLLTDFRLLGGSRLVALIRTAGIQGALLGTLAAIAAGPGFGVAAGLAVLTAAVKGLVLPRLLLRAIRRVAIRREVEPIVGYTASLALGVLALGAVARLAGELPLPRGEAPALLLTTSLFTGLTGLFLVVARRKAILQALGYLVFENGVYGFGLAVAHEEPLLVQLGVLLDLFVAVFVMGIIVFHIQRDFEHIDVDRLSASRDTGEPEPREGLP